MKPTLLVLLALACICVNAQRPLPVVPEVTVADLQLKDCDFEKGAPAMKLFDIQQAKLELWGNEPRITTEKRVRIKIFNDKGMKYANISIPYYAHRRQTKMEDISGVIYNLDSSGHIVTQKLEKDQIFKSQEQKNVKSLKFTFKDVRPGSIIEFRYKKVEKQTYSFDTWTYQTRIPSSLSVEELVDAPIANVKYNVVAATRLDTSVTNFTHHNEFLTQYLFVAKNTPSFRDEPFMSSEKDNLQRVEFSVNPVGFGFFSFSSLRYSDEWSKMNRALYGAPFFGQQFAREIPGAKAIIDSAKKLATIDAKVKFIYDTVRRLIKWDETRSIGSDNLDEVWTNRSGNNAEINLTILNLLRKSGVTCDAMLSSTRDNGMPNMKFANPRQFNTVYILVVDSLTTYILDGTVKYTSYKVFPYNSLNRDCFIIDSLKGNWVNVHDSRMLDKQQLSYKTMIDSSGNISGDAYLLQYDYAKEITLTAREEKAENGDKEDDKPADLVIENVSEENANDLLQPLATKFKFHEPVKHSGNLYYFNPVSITPIRNNPFILESRNTDVDFGCNQSFSINMYLELPKNMMIESLPKSILLRDPDSTIILRRICGIDNNNISFRVTMDILQSTFTKEEYPVLREFYKKAYTFLDEQIVMKKNE